MFFEFIRIIAPLITPAFFQDNRGLVSYIINTKSPTFILQAENATVKRLTTKA